MTKDSNCFAPEEEKKKIDITKKMEQLGLLPFTDDEDDDLLLASHKLESSNKSQDSHKLAVKTEGTQPNTPMPRTVSKTLLEGR